MFQRLAIHEFQSSNNNSNSNNRFMFPPFPTIRKGYEPATIIEIESNSNIRNYRLYNPVDLATSLKPLLMVGRFIGSIPLNGIMTGRADQLRFSWFSFASITSLIIILSLGVNVGVGLIGFFNSFHSNPKDLAFSFHALAFYGVGLFQYIYTLRNMHRFLAALKVWNESRFHFSLEDYSLWKDSLLITSIILGSITIENISWHIKHFTTEDANQWTNQDATPKHVDKSNMTSLLQKFYATSEPDWGSLFSYHPLTSLFIMITNKWATYVWNYTEILIIVISRAIYHKFKTLSEASMVYGESQCNWKLLITDHGTLCSILRVFDEFLSPLILGSFFVNTYYVCVHICLGLSINTQMSLISSFYSTWSFMHKIGRFYIVCIAASRINVHASELHTLLRKCPTSLYTFEIDKYEKQLYYLGHNDDVGLGLTGLGYFTITKSLMLKVLGVVFTIEIVLLQNTK